MDQPRRIRVQVEFYIARPITQVRIDSIQVANIAAIVSALRLRLSVYGAMSRRNVLVSCVRYKKLPMKYRSVNADQFPLPFLHQ
jgi:hypothetical protein